MGHWNPGRRPYPIYACILDLGSWSGYSTRCIQYKAGSLHRSLAQVYAILGSRCGGWAATTTTTTTNIINYHNNTTRLNSQQRFDTIIYYETLIGETSIYRQLHLPHDWWIWAAKKQDQLQQSDMSCHKNDSNKHRSKLSKKMQKTSNQLNLRKQKNNTNKNQNMTRHQSMDSSYH